MFLFADNYFQQVMQYREVWLKGRRRSGKSLLAFATIDELIKRKVLDGSIANIPWGLPLHKWNDTFTDDDGNEKYILARRCGFVYDEAGSTANGLDNRTSLTNDRSYGQFAAKFGYVVMYPSVIPIDKRNSYLQTQRVTRFSIPIVAQLIKLMLWLAGLLAGVKYIGFVGKLVAGLLTPVAWLSEEIWVFRWSVEMGDVLDTGVFFLLRPSDYYGLYDTGATPIDDGDIKELLTRTVIDDKQFDYENGGWWVYADNNTAGLSDEWQEIAGATAYYEHANSKGDNIETDNNANASSEETVSGGNLETGETETGIDTGTNSDNITKIREIAQPFLVRPNVQYDPGDKY